jgi:hypothetical protein
VQAEEVKDLKGYEVKFDYKGHSKEREIAYNYWMQRYKDSEIRKEDIGIDLYDVSGDGKKEILTYLNSQGYCGTLGCSFSILKYNVESNIYNPILFHGLTELTVNENIKILSSSTLNYHDIAFYERYNPKPAIWRWDGENYHIIQRSRENI